MKIVFEKLQTSSENVYVDFGDGIWQSYPVNEAKVNGINIPVTCEDYSRIRIKGKSEIFPNLDVITGIKSIEEQKYYLYPLVLSSDYGNIYIGTDSSIFWNCSTELYVYYNNEYFEIGSSSDHLCEPYLHCSYIKLNNDILPIKYEFNIVDGQFSDSYEVDPDNLVSILTYEKGVGGTASIKGVEINYTTDNPNFGEDYDYSEYHWSSPDISDYGSDSYIYITENRYETFDGMSEKLREPLLENGPIDVYTKLADGKYYKMPIKLT